MEALETLAADPPPSDASGGRSEAAAPQPASRVSPDASEAEMDEDEESPFEHGDLVWAEADPKAHSDGPAWWPAMAVYPERGVMQVRFYGGGEGEKSRRTLAQLRRFVTEFEQMAAQSRSNSFLGAVREAVSELARRLDERLLCYCRTQSNAGVPYRRMRFDERDGLPVGDFSAGEFVEKIRGAAGHVMGVNFLEVTVLISWANALRNRRSHGFDGGDGGLSFLDLEEESDVLGGNVVVERKGDVGAECSLSGGGVLRRVMVADESNSRKHKSIYELIACPDIRQDEHVLKGPKKDLDLGQENVPSTIVSHCKRKKGGDAPNVLGVDDIAVVGEVSPLEHKLKMNGESRRVSDVEDGVVVAKYVVGSGRRERKKSKYLSPPFTDMSWYGKSYMWGGGKHTLVADNEEASLSKKDPETPEAVMATPIPNHTLENRQMDEHATKVLLTDEDTSIEKILNDLCSCAANYLHFKSNHSTKAASKFLMNFRRSVYVGSPNFKDYQEVGDKKLIEKRHIETVSRKDKSYGKVNGARKEDSNGKKLECNEMASVPPQKRKHVKKETGSTGAHFKADPSFVDDRREAASHGKRRINMVNSADQTVIDLEDDSLISLKASTLIQKIIRSKALANCSTAALDGQKTSGQHASSSLKRKKGKSLMNDGTVVDSGINHVNVSEATGLTQKINKNAEPDGVDMQTLVLKFTPGCLMPSKDELLLTFSKFGAVVASRTKLLTNSHSARVLFEKAADAKQAFESMDGMVISGASIANYKLQVLSKNIAPQIQKSAVSNTPLPYIKKSLEKMIAKLVESPATPKDGRGQLKRLRPDLAADLANDMDSMLQKVNKMLNEASVSTII